MAVKVNFVAGQSEGSLSRRSSRVCRVATVRQLTRFRHVRSERNWPQRANVVPAGVLVQALSNQTPSLESLWQHSCMEPTSLGTFPHPERRRLNMRCSRGIATFLFLFAFVWAAAAEDSAGRLARILADKGIIAPSDLEMVRAADPETRVQLLASILEGKGVLSRAEVASLGPGLMPAVYNAEAGPQVASAPKPAAESAPPVTSEKHFPVTIYGTLLTNAFYNPSLTNIQYIPRFAGKQGCGPLGNDKNFGMTARQSRFGMRYQGPKVSGAQISGQFEFDLLGGKAAFGNGINMDLFRLRLAF